MNKLENLRLSIIFIVLILGLTACAPNSAADRTDPAADGATPDAEAARPDKEDKAESSAKPTEEPEQTEVKKENQKGDQIESIYTDLDPKKCKTIESEMEGYYSVQECPGVAGYKLQVVESDIRQTINVIAPSGGKYELDFPKNVSYAFSYVGQKAEWRVRKEDGRIRPVALIVRYNTSGIPEADIKDMSYLVVTKFEGEFICITDVVKPVKNANEKARQLADASAGKPCLKGNR